MKKEIITDTLRKLSYKNISMDTTIGRNQIANELIKSLNLEKDDCVTEPDGWEVGPWHDTKGNLKW